MKRKTEKLDEYRIVSTFNTRSYKDEFYVERRHLITERFWNWRKFRCIEIQYSQYVTIFERGFGGNDLYMACVKFNTEREAKDYIDNIRKAESYEARVVNY